MNTLLIGNFGDKNLGDELILASALRDYPGALVMTSDPSFSRTFTGQQFQTVPFPPTGVRSWVKYFTDKSYKDELGLLKEVETIVFPGGGLFAIHWRACALWWQVFAWCKKSAPQAEIHFEHQGVDQNLSWFSRYLITLVFTKAENISVRDQASQKALSKLIKTSPDIQNDRVENYLRDLGYVNSNKEKLVVVNALRSFDITKIEAQYPQYKLVFVPFALSDLKNIPDDFDHEVVFPTTQDELFDWLSRAEILIGERFHSLVCGYHFCGPKKTFLLRSPYSEKVQSFAQREAIQVL